MNRMGRFTQRARQALMLAQTSTEQLQHSRIGSEHLLLGLVQENTGVAGTVLRDLGLKRQQVEALVKELSTAGSGGARQPELAPSARKTLEKAVNQARKLGHHYIGTEHLLLGLIEQENSTAMTILGRLGVTAEQVRQSTLSRMQESPEDQVRSFPVFPPLEEERRRVLTMIEQGKITAQEGAELLSALQIVAIPFPLGTNAAQMFAASSGVPMEQLQGREMRLVVWQGSETQLEIRQPMRQIQGDYFLFMQRFYSGQVGKVLDLKVGDKTIDVYIDEPSDDESGAGEP